MWRRRRITVRPARSKTRLELAYIDAMANPLRWSAIAENVALPSPSRQERRVSVFCRGSAGELLLIAGERWEYQPPTSLSVPLARDGNATVPVD